MAIPFHERQREAIEHLEGPMLVVAGAGTGKTRVLVERVARLIEAGHARPEEILAVTYTKEAAAQLRRRVQERVGEAGAKGLRADTFHGFAYGLIQAAGRAFDTLDDKDLWVYLRRRLRELPLERFRKAAQPAKFLEDLLDFFRRCHDELVDPAAYENYVERVARGELPLPRVSKSKQAEELPPEEALERCREIARVYRAVEEMLRADNFGTFGHQILGAVRRLREDPASLERERKRTRFLLVDEFQDSNVAQIELVALLAGEARNLFAVGDPDQAIYRFRGATSAAFDEFLRRFPDARTVRLEDNHRSTSNILRCAHAVVRRNPPVARPGSSLGGEFERQPLRSMREEEAARAGRPLPAAVVEMVLADGAHAEAAAIAQAIRDRHDELQCRWSDFAVLYRQHNHRRLLVEELERRQVPYAVENLNVLDTGPVRDLLACLRSVASPSDSVSLLRLAALPQFSLDGIRLRNLLAREKESTGFRKALERFPGGKRLLRCRDEAARAASAPLMTLSSLLPPLALAFGLELESEPVAAFQKFVQDWEVKPLPGEKTLRGFLEYLEYFVEAGGAVSAGSDPTEDAVRLMTIHTAKGLEFRHVSVIRVNSPALPISYREHLFDFPQELRRSAAPEDPKEVHYQEELRLFYVAMTRAQDSLTLSSGRRGGKNPVPERFLRQIAEEKAVSACWRRKDAAPYRIDLEAGAAVSAVAPWMLLPPRWTPGELSLSATGVESYELCPLQFKIKYDWALPGEPTAAMQYGNAVHTVLKRYYDSVRAGQPLSSEQVEEEFRREFAKAALDDSHQRELYERQGIAQLREFLAARQSEPPPEVLDTEKTFSVEIGGARLRGRVDRLDRCGEDGVAIVDYKTGAPRSQEEADESLQLSIYALAAQRQWKLEPRRLVFYNLETNQAIETKRSPKQLEDAERQVRIAAENIAQGLFPAKPGWHCRWCSYRSLCPETEERLFTIQRALEPTGAN
ncbi:MAG: ATP-dependent helicase [Terriglobales bacterium]